MIIFFDNVKFFLRQKVFTSLLLFSCFLGYGFTITHYSMGLDDTVFNKFFFQGGLLAQGRFGLVLLNRLIFTSEFIPFWNNFLAVFFFFWSVLIWCALFKTIVGKKLSIISYIIFSTVFVSYPLIYEIFVFSGINIAICLSYGLVAISLLFMYLYIGKNESVINFYYSFLINIFFISIYESFVVVWISGFLIFLILDRIYNGEEKRSFKSYASIFIKILILLFASLIVKMAISYSIIHFLKIHIKNVAANSISWIYTGTYFNNILPVLKQTVATYFLYSQVYFPLVVFLLAIFVTLICIVILARKTKSRKLILLLLLLIFSNFLLTFLQCTMTNYRALQVFALFVAFVFMLAYNLLPQKKWIKVLYLILIGFLVINQTKDLNQRFFNNFERYQEERQTVIEVGSRINEDFDTNKPIVFIGYPELSNHVTHFGIRKDNKSLTVIEAYSKKRWEKSSIIRWGVTAFDENATELMTFFRINGYDFQQANDSQYAKGKEAARKIPIWPKTGSIQEIDDFILVNFGEKGN